jgi:hypothetical protein
VTLAGHPPVPMIGADNLSEPTSTRRRRERDRGFADPPGEEAGLVPEAFLDHHDVRIEQVLFLPFDRDMLAGHPILALVSGMCTSLLLVVGFASAFLRLQHEYGAGILFALAVALLGGSLFRFSQEVRSGSARVIITGKLTRNGVSHL